MSVVYIPKHYRSTKGCCICKAKSSSSRFTDSQRYEPDLAPCFKLPEPREGEICNACVLLVKRFKKLPKGDDRNWAHVVDARVGPGQKSMKKCKRKIQQQQQQQPLPKDDDLAIEKTDSSNESSTSGNDMVVSDDIVMMETAATTIADNRNSIDEDISIADTKILSPLPIRLSGTKLRKQGRPIKNRQAIYAPIIDLVSWRPLKTCCGDIYKHVATNTIIIHDDSYKQCEYHENLYKRKSANSTNISNTNISDISHSNCSRINSNKNNINTSGDIVNTYMKNYNETDLGNKDQPELDSNLIKRIQELQEKYYQITVKALDTTVTSSLTSSNTANNNDMSQKLLETIDNSSDSGYDENLPFNNIESEYARNHIISNRVLDKQN